MTHLPPNPAQLPANPANLPRRDFLKSILAAGAASTVSIITSKNLLAAPKPDKTAKPRTGPKVRLACIGLANRGVDDIKNFADTGLAEIVALCDTNAKVKPPLKTLEGVPRFQDFRQMFDKMGKQIDAVCIAIPDFSHFPAAILAMSLGKHVYVEKPLAHTFHQIDLLMAAEKKYKVVTQMGNQGHSEGNFFQFRTWTDAGIIKNVTRIDAFMNNARRWHDAETLKKYKIAYSKLTGYLPEQPIPPGLDWNVWLTVALDHKYNKGYTPEEWRSWYDFGNGVLGDWGAHIFDTAHQFLDLGLPESIDAKLEGHNPFVFPQATTLAFRFPKRGAMPPLTLTWYDGADNKPPLPPEMPATTNDGEPIRLSPGKFIYGEGLTFKGGAHGSTLQIIPATKAREMAAQLPVVPKSSSNHWKNFLLSCLGEEKPRSPFSVAGPLCQMMALGIIAQRLNAANLKFDRATRQFTNNDAANKLLNDVTPRKGWEQFYKL